jgi:DNA-directed RNA polymerase subunit RPC12/RpoP
MNAAAVAKPKAARDCLDCGRANTMQLQNALGTLPKNIQLLYICYACGTTLKIPPDVLSKTRLP